MEGKRDVDRAKDRKKQKEIHGERLTRKQGRNREAGYRDEGARGRGKQKGLGEAEK